jgi:hypothetical protein
MKKVIAWLVVLLALMGASLAEDAVSSCKGTTIPVVGECFSFHGRLGLYNGGHTFWIWKVGTSHRYWVEGVLPIVNEGSLDFDHFYWGNFDACPTTVFKKGFAQGICLRSTGKLTITEKTN